MDSERSITRPTPEEAFRALRKKPELEQFIRDSYVDLDVRAAAERFSASEEFAETIRVINRYVAPDSVLDLGAGNGIATFAFAKLGLRVFAVEPDPSGEIGAGAIRRVMDGVPFELLAVRGEAIPLPDESVSVVYARQVLHHAADLDRMIDESRRVLRIGGVMIAVREHVVDDDAQLREFLAAHPVHQLAGNEGAYSLDRYLAAFERAGMTLREVMGPFDSIVNAFPTVRTQDELKSLPRRLLKRRLGPLAALVERIPGIDELLWSRLNRPTAGRLHSFVASREANWSELKRVAAEGSRGSR